jgi:hypothetical protein
MGKPMDKISSPGAETKLLKPETLFLTTCNNIIIIIINIFYNAGLLWRYSYLCTGPEALRVPTVIS